MKCPGCGVENVAEMERCGSCGSMLNGDGTDSKPSGFERDMRWDAALSSPNKYSETPNESAARSQRSRTSGNLKTASEILVVGLIFIIISFALFAYSAEKAESTSAGDFDAIEDIVKAEKWADYTRYIGEIMTVAGLIGIAFALSRVIW